MAKSDASVTMRIGAFMHGCVKHVALTNSSFAFSKALSASGHNSIFVLSFFFEFFKYASSGASMLAAFGKLNL